MIKVQTAAEKAHEDVIDALSECDQFLDMPPELQQLIRELMELAFRRGAQWRLNQIMASNPPKPK